MTGLDSLRKSDVFFIQIGSNDGRTGDPLHDYIKQYHWRGILIEPLPHAFKKLKSTYRGVKGLHFENVAIARRSGIRKFYRVKTTRDDPPHFAQLASFKKTVVVKHKKWIPDFQRRLVTEHVRCMGLQRLLRKYHVRHLDLLHIDTEGFDYEIIKLIPFPSMTPFRIFYEHRHLTNADRLACHALLRQKGYALSVGRWDTLACLDTDKTTPLSPIEADTVHGHSHIRSGPVPRGM